MKGCPYVISKSIFGHTLLAGNTSVTNCSLNTSSTFNTEYEEIEFQVLIREIHFVSNNPNKYNLETVDSSHSITVQYFSLRIPWSIPQPSAVFNEMTDLLKCNFKSTKKKKSIFSPPVPEYIRMTKYSGNNNNHNKKMARNTPGFKSFDSSLKYAVSQKCIHQSIKTFFF